jgi:hypothetical protein
MEKTCQYQQQIFAGLELEIYNDLLKNNKIYLQCRYVKEKTPRNFQFGKKSAKVYHCLYSWTEQLQVAL